MEANQFIQVIEHRQGLKIACLEEIGFRNKWIGVEELSKLADQMRKVDYGSYLQSIASKGKSDEISFSA